MTGSHITRFAATAALILLASAAGGQEVTNTTDPDEIAAECGGTPDAGELLFVTCAGCHALQPETGEGLAGPHLGGIVGRRIASLEGYTYSAGLSLRGSAGTTWDREALHAYLADAEAPGNHPHVADEQSRRDIMTYMRIATLPPPPKLGELDLPEEVFALEGDPAYGEYLGSECAGCHAGGNASSPALDTYDRRYFITALHEYRQRARQNETMRLIAGRLSDEEIAALAAYFTEG